MDNKGKVIEQLCRLGLSDNEARLYLELLREPRTHMRLAHATGINRTKVYRLASELERRSLITRRTDDKGMFLVAADPSTLEVEIATEEERLKMRRKTFDQLLPMLAGIQGSDPSRFVVRTYEGVEGFKQMLWHELKTKREAVFFGSGTIEDLVSSRRWAEKHRAMTVEAGYRIRELLNSGEDITSTTNKDYEKCHIHRYIPVTQLLLRSQIGIYNDTVVIYHWRYDQKVGLEIVNEAYAQMQRQIFEYYWQLATEPPPRPQLGRR